MMKRLFLLISIPVVLSSCLKDPEPYKCTYTAPTTVAPDAEIAAVQAYINSKGLSGSVTRHPNGFYYNIDDEGTGLNPAVCSNISVSYEGKLTNDTKFDESAGATFLLGDLIKGWQLGLPLIKKGGTIKLYLPPSLGYGSVAKGSIPANSILIFEVHLIDVVN